MRWREEEEALAEFEEAANRDPVGFARRIPKCVAIMCQVHNGYVNYLLARFGVQYRVRLIGSEFHSRRFRVVNPRRRARTRFEQSRYETARHEIMKLEAIISVLLAAVEGADAAPGGEERALTEAFLRCLRRMPVLYGVDMQRAEDPGLRRGATLALSAWLAVFISTDEALRLKRALADEGMTLFEALPPAAFISFVDWNPKEPLRPRKRKTGKRKRSLVSRASTHITKLGDEATFRPKHVVTEYGHTVSVLREVKPSRPDFSVLQGWEDLILPSLLAGADGSICAFANVAPELFVALVRAAQGGDLERAAELHRRVLSLVTLGAQSDPPMGAIKLAMNVLGVPISSAVRGPALPAPPGAEERVRAALEEAGLLAVSEEV